LNCYLSAILGGKAGRGYKENSEVNLLIQKTHVVQEKKNEGDSDLCTKGDGHSDRFCTLQFLVTMAARRKARSRLSFALCDRGHVSIVSEII